MDTTNFDKLILRMTQGDKSALKEFYKEYANIIAKTAFVFLKDFHLAEDVVNEILIKVWNYAPKIKNIKNPNGWVYCVTKNFCLNMLKKKKAHAMPDSIANTVAHKADGIQIEEANIQFKQMISCLNEKEQQIVILKILVGYTFKEIAKEMKIKQNSVVKNYYRSLEKLKKYVQNCDE